MYAKETDSTTENDLLCMIHRLEDKLFRKKKSIWTRKIEICYYALSKAAI